MRKIGFLDYYIDEWHANNYPRWIRESSRRAEFEVALAWQEMQPPDRKSLQAWCQEQGVGVASSAEQVVAECDCLVVLSPDNPERHEALCDLPLRSGKRVYVDKTFSPDYATAQRLFAKAEQHHTPMYSSSALRYVEGLERAVQQIAGQRVRFVGTGGPGVWSIYAVHQLEPLVMLLGTGASRVMSAGNAQANVLVIDYPDGRRGCMTQTPDHPFQFHARYGEKTVSISDVGDFFPRFIEAMLTFFATGEGAVPKEQTLEIMALLEAGTSALASPDQWVRVPGG